MIPPVPMEPLDGRSTQNGGPPLRVALFTGNYNHIPDGVSRTLNRVVGFLEQRGVPVLVFGPTVSEPPVDHEGEFVPVPSIAAPGRSEYRLSTGFPRRTQHRLEAFAPTLVHVATPDLLGMRALRWARQHGIPAVATYHTHFTSYLPYYRLAWLEGALWSYGRWFYSQCEEVYVPSPPMADVLRTHGIDSTLRIWERGVETDRFHPRRRDLEWRRSLGIEDDEVVIAFVSRLVSEKGLDVYAGVMRRLAERELPVRALVVGEGPAGDALRSELPPDAVMLGHLEGDDLPRAYASSDVFLFPSHTETFGNVTLEAMASGLPTVCADATGSRHLVDHGETGFLAPPHDVPAFLDATARLVADPALRARFGASGRLRAEHYDWQVVLERLLGYYVDVLARRGLTAAIPAPG